VFELPGQHVRKHLGILVLVGREAATALDIVVVQRRKSENPI
jgi:hypothetical protein